MNEKHETMIIGGGQAGLAASYYLKKQGLEHIILEQSLHPAYAWRSDRWDSFTLNSPNWSFKLPGRGYQGSKPEGFMPRDEIVSTFEQYIEYYHLPVKYGEKVTSLESLGEKKGYQVTTENDTYTARNVVVATGFFQIPKIPAFASAISPHITQIHSGQYRNPNSIPPGAVLVVGSAQSGCQIAEELYQSGRKVYLCIGSAGRVPRRYRGKDIFEWMYMSGFFDRTVDTIPSPKAKFSSMPHISGRDGGHTLNLHQFARDGVTLLGHLDSADGFKLSLAADLKKNLTLSDQFEVELCKKIDDFITVKGLSAPLDDLPSLNDAYRQEEISELDLSSAGISTIIWAMGYNYNYNLVKLPVFDSDGYPIQTRGVTESPGLYFIGLPWLYKVKSGLLIGIGEDAEYLSEKIAERVI